jgi:hypothetical protein
MAALDHHFKARRNLLAGIGAVNRSSLQIPLKNG